MRLIYLSPVPWTSFSQRPHELVSYFHSRTGGEVLWVDPYPTRFPSVADVLRRPLVCNEEDNPIPYWLTLVRPKLLPIEPLPFSFAINRSFCRETVAIIERFAGKGQTVFGIGKPSSLALWLLSKRLFTFSFYDAMDDFPAFYSGLSRFSMAHRERKIVLRVSQVLTSSTALKDRLGTLIQDVRLVLNACASDRLPKLENRVTFRDRLAPVLGYVGTVGKWFDWKTVKTLAESWPNAKLRIIGPIYVTPSVSLPGNVSLEPSRPHADALVAMTDFDIGLIPFKNTRLTFSVDPIKYYEYRAMGLPVISTEFGEMSNKGEFDGVYLINKNTDMRDIVRQALAYRSTEDDILQFRKENSWERRFDEARIFIP